MKNKNMMLTLLVIICLVLVGGVGYTVYRDWAQKKAVESDSAEVTDNYITWNGRKYKKDPNVFTVLFMGIDREAQAEVGNRVGDGGQADSLNLLVLNRETKTGQIIQISRDSIVDIDVFDNYNELIMTIPGQIALQYAYGDGKDRSCRLTGERVSELMNGIEVDSYLSMTLDGISSAVDAIGGVAITVPRDYTDIDPVLVEGTEVVLNGELAERYVRSRDTDVLDSNNQRMERQAQFMDALIRKLFAMDQDSYLSLYQQMEPYLSTNMTAEELTNLSGFSYDEEVITLPGEVVLAEEHAQYLVDVEKMKEIVVKSFYKHVK